ncbi:MAG: hypothetical protein HQK99_07515 [Nitrospirae bacterium]|nr:hypothetical protein [Nitrospirota bacterium]
MKRIIVIDDQWDMDSPVLKYALKASKAADTEIIGILPVRGATQSTKLQRQLNAAGQKLASEGVSFSSYIVGTEREEFISRIKGLTPASLVLVGDTVFSGLLKGTITIETLKKEISCPVTTARALDSAPKKIGKGINLISFIAYAMGSIIIYGVFFPKIITLNAKLFMSMTVQGAIAVMAVVVVHAWVWGNTVHVLPKMFRLEK